MEQTGGGDNVIYVQVDEQGRVLNYTSNMSGGEQVILLQDSGSGQQPVLVEAPSTSGPLTSPTSASQPAEPVLVTSNQAASVGDTTVQEQLTVTEQPVTGEHISEPQSTVISQPKNQPTLVDQSGTPVMLIGQPEPVLSAPPVTPAPPKTVTSSISGIGQVTKSVASQVVDQSGLPVVVLGATSTPKPAPTAGISIINRPQLISPGGTTNIIRKPVVQRSLVQGQKIVSHFPRGNVPAGSVLISKQGKTYLATPKPIGQPGVITGPQKVGQAAGNILTRPVLKTATGPVLLSAKTKPNIPQPGRSGVVLVSRPHVQISNAPLILSKQKSPLDTKTSGVISFPPSITVSQPVLTVIKEHTVEATKTHQTSEVTSTVNGTEPEESEPIEIPDTDDEDTLKETPFTPVTSKVKDDDTTVSTKEEDETSDEVLQDVTMDVGKEDEKSEEELMDETTTTAEQKETEMSEEKVQQDMDSDLLMYLGGDSVKQDEEKGIVSSMVPQREKKPDEQVDVGQANMEVSEQAMEVETESREEQPDEVAEEAEQQVESTTVSDDEFEDEDDGTLPAGLIRGEPIQMSPKTEGPKDVVNNKEEEHDDPEKEETTEEAKLPLEESAENRGKPEDDFDTVEEPKHIEPNASTVDEEVEEKEQKQVVPDHSDTPDKDIMSEEATSTQDDSQEPLQDKKHVEPVMESEAGVSQDEQTVSDEKAVPGKGLRQRGRGRKSGNKKDTADTPEEVDKKSFMANFNLVSPREMEKLSQRRSKRVSNAEAVKQKEDDTDSTPGTNNKVSSGAKSETLKKSETPRSYKSYKTLDEDSSGRQNIFELFDSKDVDKDGSVESLKARIQKLLAVNAELKTRLRESDHKAASNQASNARFHEIKALQHKVEKLEKKNAEVSQRLESYEGKPSPPERTVDVSFRMGRLSFKSPASIGQVGGISNVTSVSPGKPKPDEGQEKAGGTKSKEALEKKEMKLRALDQELDQRMVILKTKEGKLQRLIMDVKSREKKVEYQESAIERRVKDIEYRERMLEGKTKAALEKMNKDGGGGSVKGQPEDRVRSAEMKRFEQELEQRKLKEREATLKEREDAVAEKEKYLQVTEKELAALGADLKEQFHSIKITGKGAKGGKLPSSLLVRGRQRKSLPDDSDKPLPSSGKKIGRKSVGATPKASVKTKDQQNSKDQMEVDVSELVSPAVKKKRGKKMEEDDSSISVSSEKPSSVSTESGKKGRQSKKSQGTPQPKIPKNLAIDMNDKPSSGGRARPALTRRSMGEVGKTRTPKSTTRKRTRTVSPATVAKPRVWGKKARK